MTRRHPVKPGSAACYGAVYLDRDECPEAEARKQIEGMQSYVGRAPTAAAIFDVIATREQVASGAARDAVNDVLDAIQTAKLGERVVVGVTTDEKRRPGRDLITGRLPDAIAAELLRTGRAVWDGVTVEVYEPTSRPARRGPQGEPGT